MTVPFFGVLGGQMAIYFLTFLFGLFLSLKNKSELSVPLEVPKPKLTLLVSVITICGIPIAMLLNALAGVFTTAGADDASDVNKYPLWVAVICFAVVPAIVEEFIFRGIIGFTFIYIGYTFKKYFLDDYNKLRQVILSNVAQLKIMSDNLVQEMEIEGYNPDLVPAYSKLIETSNKSLKITKQKRNRPESRFL